MEHNERTDILQYIKEIGRGETCNREEEMIQDARIDGWMDGPFLLWSIHTFMCIFKRQGSIKETFVILCKACTSQLTLTCVVVFQNTDITYKALQKS